MRQLCVTEHAVADGVYAGDVGLHLVVDENTTLIVVDLAGGQIQRGGVGLAADGHQHLLRLEADGVAGLIQAAHALHGGVQLVEQLLADLGGKLAGEAAALDLLGDDDGVVGLGNGLDNGVPIQRHQRPQIQHLGLDALLGQLGGRFHGEVHLAAPGDDGDVLALPLDSGLSQRNGVFLLGDLLLLGVQQLVLQEDNGIVVPDIWITTTTAGSRQN